jgi:hypothetical protein
MNAEQKPDTWTIDDVIEDQERQGKIVPPFTPDERALALCVAEAWYFYEQLTELPARAPHGSRAHFALFAGVHRVNQRRSSTSPATSD